MSQTNHQDRRIFDRTPLHKEINVDGEQREQPFSTAMIDVSLKGLLIKLPEDVSLKTEDAVQITIQLSDEQEIRLNGRVVHVETDEAGIEWTKMDGDSFAHFRRMIELNLGDPDEIKREIPRLGSDERMETDDTGQPDRHLEGEGHAHHQFNPERAAEFHDAQRINRLKPRKLLESLDVQPTDQVLDLATGSGALLSDFSAYVEQGTVIGADISEQMLEKAREEVNEASLSNVVLVSNTADSLPLVDRTQEAVAIVSSLHEFSEPIAMLEEVTRVLKKDGKLGIVEWRNEETEEGPPVDHRLSPDTIDEWLGEAGMVLRDKTEWTETGYDLFVADKF